jgi:dTDP-4-dehydrorhamnose 3,5-epimerase-like enzyme
MSLNQCRIIELPKISDPRGNLSFIEGDHQIPFEIRRVFYLYDLPEGADRGLHGHRKLHEFIIAAAGSFDVELDDGMQKRRYHLSRSYIGLYVPPLTWARLCNFSSGAVCLVLASELYDPDDYIHDYADFLRAAIPLELSRTA